MTVRLLVGDCRAMLATLPDASVHACITSPPYYGLRAYGTNPQVWGGDPACSHAWDGERIEVDNRTTVNLNRRKGTSGGAWDQPRVGVVERAYCTRCAAWRGELGSEPTPELFCSNLVTVFREVRRVLHPTGVLVLNLGDSYAGSGKGPTGHNGIGDQAERQGFSSRATRAKGGLQGGTTTVDVSYGGKAAAGYKAKDLMQMPFKVAEALRQDGWYLRSMMPWLKRCLSGGTWLYARTQKGDMPMTVRELARLDPATVQLWNGRRWTQVTAIWETPKVKDNIEIEFRSGETVGCTANHVWPTRRGNVRADALTLGDVVSVTLLPERADKAMPSGLDDEMVGWLVGLYVAEGWKDERTIHIAGHVKETERLARLEVIAAAFDGSCRYRFNQGQSATINLSGPVLFGILDAYVFGHGAEAKHLTSRAWQRSDRFIRAVLDGYLSGDGHWDAKNRRWRLGFCKNDRWAQDMRTICARLGVQLSLRRAKHKLNGRVLPGWRGEIRFERAERQEGVGHFARHEAGEIVRIGRSRGRRFFDIAVEDEPHLFALASGVLTHNSAMPESVQDRPSNALEWLFLFSKAPRYFWDSDAIRREYNPDSIGRYDSPMQDTAPNCRLPGGDVGRRVRDLGIKQPNPAGRAFRNTDPWFISLDAAIADARADLARLEAMRATGGVLADGEGLPLAVDINPVAYKEAHFATYPPALVVPFVKAGTSERGACPRCLAPWGRVVERGNAGHHCRPGCGHQRLEDFGTHGWDGGKYGGFSATANVTGQWMAGCACDAGEPIPCTILDPFAGSGTTLLVADRLGRDAVGCELSEAYAQLARERLAGDAPMLTEVETTAGDYAPLGLFGEAAS